MPDDSSRSAPEQVDVKERAELWRHLEKIRFAMLSTHDRDGSLAARPVTTQQCELDGTVWFFIPAQGGIVEDLGRNPRVGLTYADLSDNFFAALRGVGLIIRDRAKARELWSPLVAAWFPGGPEDPNLLLLRVDVDRGEYWDPDASKLVQFFTMAKAALTRKPPDYTGEHRSFNVG